MADFYLNMTTWKTEISGGKIREVTDGVEEMKQRIGIAIKTHRGECLFDTDRGLPWTSEILVKAPDISRITNRARAYLMTIEGVVGVRRLDITLDDETRVMTWVVDCETTEGVTGPFNVVVTG